MQETKDVVSERDSLAHLSVAMMTTLYGLKAIAVGVKHAIKSTKTTSTVNKGQHKLGDRNVGIVENPKCESGASGSSQINVNI